MQPMRFGGLAGIFGSVLIALALALGAGGVWLIALGGVTYYLAAAIGLLLTGLLLAMRSRWALWSHAALLVATLAWALNEVGLDWWPLAARLDVLFVIGLALLLPWLTRALAPVARAGAPGRPVSVRRGAGLALAVALAATALPLLASLFVDRHAVDGALPPSQGAMSAVGDAVRGVPPGEWHAYGRTGFGQRYSPLAQIDVANVSRLEVAWRFQTGDFRGRPDDPVETTDEVTPLKIGDRLYLCTPHQDVIALNASTGAEVWRYRPQVEPNLALQHLTCRGLSYQPPHAAPAAGASPASSSPAARAGLPVAAASGKTSAECDAKLFYADR